jgi:hypothetical protein
MELVKAISEDRQGLTIQYKGAKVGFINKCEPVDVQVNKILKNMGYDLEMIVEFNKNLEELTSMAARVTNR